MKSLITWEAPTMERRCDRGGLMAGGLISRSPLQMLPAPPIRMLRKDSFPPVF